MPSLYQKFLAEYQKKEWSAVAALGQQLLSEASSGKKRLRDRALITGYLATAYRNLGKMAEAQAHARQARAEAAPGSYAEGYALAEGVTVHAIRGAFSEAESWGAEFLAKADEWPTPDGVRWLGVVHHNLAYVYRMRFEYAEALRHCEASAKAYKRLGNHPMNCYLQVLRAQICLQLDDIEQAGGILSGLQDHMLPPDHVVDLHLVRGQCAYLKGDLPTTLEYASMALAQTVGMPPLPPTDALAKALMGYALIDMGHSVEGKMLVQAGTDKCSRNGYFELLGLIKRLGGVRP